MESWENDCVMMNSVEARKRLSAKYVGLFLHDIDIENADSTAPTEDANDGTVRYNEHLEIVSVAWNESTHLAGNDNDARLPASRVRTR